MTERSALILVADDTAKTGASRPLFLQNIMGLPLLSWLAASMAAGGCGRFFLVCAERFRAEAAACFPQGVSLTVSPSGEVSDRMHVFLSTAEEEEREVALITSPVMILPESAAQSFRSAPVPSGAYAVNRRALMDALDATFSFPDLLGGQGRAYTDRDGWYNVNSAEELADWQPVLNRQTLRTLAAQGVEIWDYAGTFVEPGCYVGEGTVLMPGTILRRGCVIGRNCVIGPNALLEAVRAADGAKINASQLYDCVVGENASVGPFAYVRPGSVIGADCKVGDFVEVKNSVIGSGTKISHLTYVGDSDVGRRVNFGCGTVTCNYDRAKKHRTVIGDDCFIGCNTNLVAPVTVGSGAYTAAGSTITEDVPENALAIARARQSVKKDWASSHKVKEKK